SRRGVRQEDEERNRRRRRGGVRPVVDWTDIVRKGGWHVTTSTQIRRHDQSTRDGRDRGAAAAGDAGRSSDLVAYRRQFFRSRRGLRRQPGLLGQRSGRRGLEQCLTREISSLSRSPSPT